MRKRNPNLNTLHAFCQFPVKFFSSMPVPEELTTRGLPTTASVMTAAPFRILVAGGARVTLIVQLFPTENPSSKVQIRANRS
jgi:hypothetical protein